jgi:hypothetical protein
MNVSISRGGAEIGEWPEEQIRIFYKEGQLLATDLYWKEGMTEWSELSKLIKPPLPFAPNLPSTPVQLAPPLAAESVGKLNGVRGWLALFCIVQLLWRPMVYINEYIDWSKASHSDTPILFAITLGALALYGIVTSINLIRRIPNAVKYVKVFLIVVAFQEVYLWAAGAISILGSPSGKSLDIYNFVATTLDGIKLDVMQSVIYSVVWYWYFSVSKRVKATYMAG